jgi:hypothetical protein
MPEILVAGASKVVGERFFAPIVGNGTLKSGAIKLLAAMLIPKSDRYMKAVSMGVGVDGSEDIITGLLSGGIVGATQSAIAEI